MGSISNLLRYGIKDIRYEQRVKNATISAQQNFAKQDAQYTPSELSIHTEHPQIRQDSSAFFASIGMPTFSELLDNAAEKGRQAVLEATANYGIIADQMAEIDKGVTPAQIYHQKFSHPEQPSLVVTSTEPIEISYTPGDVSMQYIPSSVTTNWNVDRAIRRYTPADFGLEVLQDPSIDFKYLGGFQYVPKSATPGYSRLV